jgi:hypothetical protein
MFRTGTTKEKPQRTLIRIVDTLCDIRMSISIHAAVQCVSVATKLLFLKIIIICLPFNSFQRNINEKADLSPCTSKRQRRGRGEEAAPFILKFGKRYISELSPSCPMVLPTVKELPVPI